MAGAFAHTFWWAVVTILIAFVPTLLLPNKLRRASPLADAAAQVRTTGRRRSPDSGARVSPVD